MGTVALPAYCTLVHSPILVGLIVGSCPGTREVW